MRIGFPGAPTHQPSQAEALSSHTGPKKDAAHKKEDVTLGARGTWRAICPRQGSQPARPNSPQPAIGYRSEFRVMDRVGHGQQSLSHHPQSTLGPLREGPGWVRIRHAVRGLTLSSSLTSPAPRSHAEPADVDCGGWWECELCERGRGGRRQPRRMRKAWHGLLDSLPYLYAKCKGHQPGNSVYGRSRSSLGWVVPSLGFLLKVCRKSMFYYGIINRSI